MPKKNASILLDHSLFNSSTLQWQVPILFLKNITPKTLRVDAQEIASTEYTISGDVIIFSRSITIQKNSQVYLTVEFQEQEARVIFWLPIILALIGLLGTITQPVLHSLGILYQNHNKELYEITLPHTEYVASGNYATFRTDIVPLSRQSIFFPKDSLEDWQMFIAIKEEERDKEFDHQEYPYCSDPINLSIRSKTINVNTDKTFTKKLKDTKARVQSLLFLVKKSVIVNNHEPIIPSAIGKDNYRVIMSSIFYPYEMYEENRP